MPLYEYRCHNCGETFEKLVRSSSNNAGIKCPQCASEDVNKAFSTFATSGTSAAGSTRAADCAPGGG